LIRDLEPKVVSKVGPNEAYLQFIAADYAQQIATRTSQYIIDRGFTIQTIKAWGIRYDPEVPAIVIPIYDIKGQLVGLSRREVVPQSQPSKYMESVGFDKNQHLFGAHRHVPQGRVVIVEGPLDCIWLHQCGVTDAVALMGTYCSMAKQRLLARLGSHVVLALDNDAAGYSATLWLTEQLSAWFSVTVQRLPESVKDVQELSAIQVKLLFRW
jgi:DNA primase